MGLLLSVLVVCVGILEVLDSIYYIRVGYLGTFSSWRRRVNHVGAADGGESFSIGAALPVPDLRSVTSRSRGATPTLSPRCVSTDKQTNGVTADCHLANGTSKTSSEGAPNENVVSKPPKSARSPRTSPTSPTKETFSTPPATPEVNCPPDFPSRNESAFKKPPRLAASTDRPVSFKGTDSPDPWTRKSLPDRTYSPVSDRPQSVSSSSGSRTPSEPTTPKRSKIDISWPTFTPTHVVQRPIGLSQLEASFSIDVEEDTNMHRLSTIESSVHFTKDCQFAVDPYEAYHELQKFLEQLKLDTSGRNYSEDEDEDEEPYLNQDFEIDKLFFEESEPDDSPEPGQEYQALQEYLEFLHAHAEDSNVYEHWKKSRPSIDSGRQQNTCSLPTNPNAEYLALQEFLKVLRDQESRPNEPVIDNGFQKEQEPVLTEDSTRCEQVQQSADLSEHANESTEPAFVDPAAVRRTLEAAVIISSDEEEDEEVAAISRLGELRVDVAEVLRLTDKLEVSRTRSRSPSPQPEGRRRSSSPQPPSGTPRPSASPELAGNASSPKPVPGEPFWVRCLPPGGRGLRCGG